MVRDVRLTEGRLEETVHLEIEKKNRKVVIGNHVCVRLACRVKCLTNNSNEIT